MIVTLKPSLTVTDAQAQAIVDRIAPGRRLARVGELLAGEISAVFEIELAKGPPATSPTPPRSRRSGLRLGAPPDPLDHGTRLA